MCQSSVALCHDGYRPAENNNQQNHCACGGEEDGTKSKYIGCVLVKIYGNDVRDEFYCAVCCVWRKKNVLHFDVLHFDVLHFEL